MSRIGTGRRLGSSRTRVDRNPCGSATGSLHNPFPYLGAVEVESLGLRGSANVQNPLVVTRKDESETALVVVPACEQPSGDGGLSPLPMLDQELVYDLYVIAAQRHQIDKIVIDAVLAQIQYIGHTTGHTGSEVATGRPKDQDGATRHVLTAVVTQSFDHRGGAGVANAESLAHLTTQEDLAACRSVGDHVAGDDVVLRRQRG